ncbi:hypothetical protein A9P82_14390 [Arachidicoccus ginsenosidimutans]|uniref:DUF3857 domain-containing protein n=1 Tax=Arachidicoccus sp. BS20 TaxID=1850526 RepID=UPI0007F06CF5|nr:DUF3857 domain-containing protein [Arachidicoccus sp. BS20]ANI90373.1 hypothetical protein A9P82_14390 [Arachidicoccus sp. BS20]
MITKKILTSFIVCTYLLAHSAVAQAQTQKYAVNNIPKNLLKHANSVKREETLHFTVKGIGDAVFQHHSVITVLNHDGDDNLSFGCYTFKFDKLDDASISVYDSLGNKIKTYSLKDLQATSYGDGLVEDGKLYYFSVTAPSYPITIEINSVEKYKGLLFYPSFDIQDKDQSVEQSSAQIIVPKTLGLRYKTINIKDNCIKKEDASNITYSWTENNLPAIKVARHSGPQYLYLPSILFAPRQFKMDDYTGDMSTWQSFGKWYGDLISTTNTLTPQEQTFYQNMVKDKTTDREKAETIYRYMQNNMRYVSIQLGIGGWKPFAASFVNTKKYGDCKALTNYMQAALSAVGIKSYPVINHFGTLSTPITKDFPVNAFNHVLLCIPQAKDSIWLECTSSSNDFGELYTETQNHLALLINEKGGELVRTPLENADENTLSSKSIINLNVDGSAVVNTQINVTGEIKQEHLAYLYQESDEHKKDFFYSYLSFKPADSIGITESNKFTTPFSYNAKLNYGNFPDFTTGSKIFMPSRLHRIFKERITDDTARKQDYYFDYPYKISDTVELHYPQGFQPEDLPKNKNISKPFASYKSEYILDTTAKTITVITHLSILQTIVKSADYKDLEDFSEHVLDDLDEKIVVNGNE